MHPGMPMITHINSLCIYNKSNSNIVTLTYIHPNKSRKKNPRSNIDHHISIYKHIQTTNLIKFIKKSQ